MEAVSDAGSSCCCAEMFAARAQHVQYRKHLALNQRCRRTRWANAVPASISCKCFLQAHLRSRVAARALQPAPGARCAAARRSRVLQAAPPSGRSTAAAAAGWQCSAARVKRSSSSRRSRERACSSGAQQQVSCCWDCTKHKAGVVMQVSLHGSWQVHSPTDLQEVLQAAIHPSTT